MSLAHYELLANLMTYPDKRLPTHVANAKALFRTSYNGASEYMEGFAALLPTQADELTPAQVDDLQEVFTRSFEVQGITTLDIGYVAFGDDYKRGELLVNLNREHRDAGLDCGTELADHLPNVLRLISCWKDRATTIELVEQLLHPVLEKMVEEFREERMEVRNKLYKKHYKTVIATSLERASIYRHALSAVLEVVRQDFQLEPTVPEEFTCDFLRSVTRELEIEARGAGKKGLPKGAEASGGTGRPSLGAPPSRSKSQFIIPTLANRRRA